MPSWKDYYEEGMSLQCGDCRPSESVARDYADNATGPQDEYTMLDAAADVPLIIYIGFGLFVFMAFTGGHLPPSIDLAIYRLQVAISHFTQGGSP